MPATASTVFVKPVLQSARSLGANVGALMKAAGVSHEVLGRWDVRIPVRNVCELCHRAAHEIGDEHFGLHAAERLPAGSLDVFWYAVANSPTLGEALEKIVRYHRLLVDAGTLELTIDAKAGRMHRLYPKNRRDRYEVLGDYFLANVISWLRQISGVDLVPKEVRFQHCAPSSTVEERRFFRAPLRFEHWGYELVFDPKLLLLPVRRYDSNLAKVLNRYADEILERLPTPDQTLGAVRRLIADEVRAGVPSLHTIAERLGMSPRTLQRALGREHATFQKELDQVRRQLAERILDEGHLSITETAFVLGFSDVSSFYRAFRRWTGGKPSQFRRPQA